MTRDEVIDAVRAHESELRAAGVESVSLFGSVARGETRPQDVDIAVKLGRKFSTGGWDYLRRLDALQLRLSEMLNCGADIVEEPVRRAYFQQEIDKDRALVF
jgi:predicted nucleotidyltransferase